MQILKLTVCALLAVICLSSASAQRLRIDDSLYVERVKSIAPSNYQPGQDVILAKRDYLGLVEIKQAYREMIKTRKAYQDSVDYLLSRTVDLEIFIEKQRKSFEDQMDSLMNAQFKKFDSAYYEQSKQVNELRSEVQLTGDRLVNISMGNLETIDNIKEALDDVKEREKPSFKRTGYARWLLRSQTLSPRGRALLIVTNVGFFTASAVGIASLFVK